jgi:HD superfamily phosphodiesterase
MIPTKEECLRLMGEYGMLENISVHSLEVSRVALFISIGLNKKGQKIDLSLVEAASLLHDLTKTECLRTKEDHAQTGSQVLKGMGYGGESCQLLFEREEESWYADNGDHDRIVSWRA